VAVIKVAGMGVTKGPWQEAELLPFGTERGWVVLSLPNNLVYVTDGKELLAAVEETSELAIKDKGGSRNLHWIPPQSLEDMYVTSK
jgi:hypothetical protein